MKRIRIVENMGLYLEWTHEERIDYLWKRDIQVVDWNQLETDIRSVLKDRLGGKLVSEESLRLIDQYVAAHTRRGSEYLFSERK
jgi:hypothetical protein